MNASPSIPSLWPHRNGNTYTLGSVQCNSIRWYNGFFVAFAPLLLIVPAYFLYRGSITTALIWLDALFIGVLLFGSIPSPADVSVVLRKPSSLILPICLGLLYYQFHSVLPLLPL